MIKLWLTALAATVALWLLFVNTARLHEWIVGTVAAILAVTASELARVEEDPQFAPHVRFLELWRVRLV